MPRLDHVGVDHRAVIATVSTSQRPTGSVVVRPNPPGELELLAVLDPHLGLHVVAGRPAHRLAGVLHRLVLTHVRGVLGRPDVRGVVGSALHLPAVEDVHRDARVDHLVVVEELAEADAGDRRLTRGGEEEGGGDHRGGGGGGRGGGGGGGRPPPWVVLLGPPVEEVGVAVPREAHAAVDLDALAVT